MRLEVRLLKAEVFETILFLYGCVTWSPKPAVTTAGNGGCIT